MDGRAIAFSCAPLPVRLGWLSLALLTAVGCSGAPRVQMERIHFLDISGAIPGWSSTGLAPASVDGGSLTLPPGAQVVQSLSEDDYPIALHLEVTLVGDGSAFAVVTRASGDSAGPLGLPRQGVALVLWDESVLGRRPFNAEVLRLEGDRLIPIGRELVRPPGETVTIDVYDDGQWVLAAIDGEVLVARETSIPTVNSLRNAWRWMPMAAHGVWDLVARPRRIPAVRSGGAVLASPLTPQAQESEARIRSITILRCAPTKTGDERGRWESLATARQRRWARPVEGYLCDAETRRPIAGAQLISTAGDRALMTDDLGHFVDTRAQETPEPLLLRHPDHPSVEITGSGEGLVEMLSAEGTGELTLLLEIDSGVPTRVTLRPLDQGRRPRHHPTPPPRGPMRFGNLPPGQWRVEVFLTDSDRPDFIGEPFQVTGVAQERTEHVGW